MQTFQIIILSLADFITNNLLVVAIALGVVAVILENKKMLKVAFWTSASVVIAHAISFGLQLIQIGQQITQIANPEQASWGLFFSNPQTIIQIGFTVVLPVVIAVAIMVLTKKNFK